ncbi:mitochondrial carrier domain-containing protein [Phyllosticta citriasiana]|uniref:mitochondrial carrier domain-containing protein n=1 Tax=Phyllosticta citriasiana TaxID=595635 RepID=UPI0030FDACEE
MSDGSRSRSSSSFHFLAGLTSGLTSAVLLQPADLLKTRVQQSHATTLRSTLRTIAAGPNPIRSLWRGTVPSALRTGFGSALYFTTLNALRTRVAAASGRPNNGRDGSYTAIGDTNANNGGSGSTSSSSSSSLPKLSPTSNLLTGGLARAGAGFVMMPITVLKVRFESSLYAYTSLLSAALDIARREGLRGFFAGFGATAVRDAPYAGLYVLFYEECKRRLGAVAGRVNASATPSSASSSSSSPWTAQAEAAAMGPSPTPAPLTASTAASVHFASGVIAAGLGTALTNPFDAIKTRLQLLPARYKHMGQAARLMLREEGVRSLFDGLGLRIARKAVSSALAWTLYEEFVRRAERAWVKGEVGL